MQTYQALARKLDAYRRCIKTGNEEWEEKHLDAINEIMKSAPSGSGIDSAFTFPLEFSNPSKLVFDFGFHHMDENGMYDGWTYHKAIVKPSLMFNYDLTITGRDRNQIKEYLYLILSSWLEEEIHDEK